MIDMKIPRKKKKHIPEGFYCYTFTGKVSKVWSEKYKTFIPTYYTKLCPFYGHIKIKDISEKDRPKWMDDEYVAEFAEEQTSWCKLLKTDIDDQCKSCSIKLGI